MRLPEFLTGLFPVGKVVDAMEQGASALETKAQRHNAQVTVSTATDGLPLWERDYGLSSDGDAAARRKRIRAALLGGKTLTRSHLASLAVTLADADAGDVEEDFPESRVCLYALYDEAVPEELPDLKEPIRRQKPAHLTVEVQPALRGQGTQRRRLALTGMGYLELHSEEGEELCD